ncbi:MAG: signal peptidase I [Leifsonia sp.]
MPGLRSGWVALVLTMAARSLLIVGSLLVLISVVPAAFGWHPTVVSSGSMQPKLRVGDVVVSRPIASSAPLRLGQVILETDPDHAGRLRLHRLVAIDGKGGVVTKGDANPQKDSSTVPLSGVLGIGALRIPYLGTPEVWVQEGEVGNLVILAAVLFALVSCALLFRQEGVDGKKPDDAPPPTKWRNTGHRVHRIAQRTPSRPQGVKRVAVVAIAGLVLGLVPATTASAAFSAVTSASAGSLATAGRFACSDRVIADGPSNYYKLGESSGTVAADSSGNNHPGTYSSAGITYGVAGPCSVDGATAVKLNGGATTGITTSNAVARPNLFTAEIWFNTTTINGGLLLGMFDSITGSGGQRDPVIYMENSGQLTFGMWDGSTTRTVASSSVYNNGAWHLLDATYSASAGMALFIDGSSVGKSAGAAANPYTGYWRIGYGVLGAPGAWPNAPLSTGFTGSVASAAIYSAVLSNAQIAQNYAAINSRANCASTVLADSPSNYYKLGESSGIVAADSSGNSITGTYTSSGVTYGAAGPCALDANTGVTLNGGAATGITTSNAVARPSVFTAEIWFKTTTITGGLMLGMFDSITTSTGQRDPVIYMENSGQITFGMWDGSKTHTVVSPSAFNNGAWHLLDATYSASIGLTLFIDGSSVGGLSGAAANVYTGYWRFGYGNVSSWPNNPTSTGFTGSVADAAIYAQSLTAQQVAAHYAAH